MPPRGGGIRRVLGPFMPPRVGRGPGIPPYMPPRVGREPGIPPYMPSYVPW